MGRKKGGTNFVKKDQFADLSDEFKDAVAGSSVDEIRKRISDVALLDCTTKALLKEDGDVAQAREALKQLMEPYRADIKSFKLQIAYCKQVLDDKGNGAAKVGSAAEAAVKFIADARSKQS